MSLAPPRTRVARGVAFTKKEGRQQPPPELTLPALGMIVLSILFRLLAVEVLKSGAGSNPPGFNATGPLCQFGSRRHPPE